MSSGSKHKDDIWCGGEKYPCALLVCELKGVRREVAPLDVAFSGSSVGLPVPAGPWELGPLLVGVGVAGGGNECEVLCLYSVLTGALVSVWG